MDKLPVMTMAHRPDRYGSQHGDGQPAQGRGSTGVRSEHDPMIGWEEEEGLLPVGGCLAWRCREHHVDL